MRGLKTPEEASKGGNINIVAAKGAGICEVVLSNGKLQRNMLLPFGKGFMWVASGVSEHHCWHSGLAEEVSAAN